MTRLCVFIKKILTLDDHGARPSGRISPEGTAGPADHFQPVGHPLNSIKSLDRHLGKLFLIVRRHLSPQNDDASMHFDLQTSQGGVACREKSGLNGVDQSRFGIARSSRRLNQHTSRR